jgi:TolC family type I secretion outer membrane protein
MNLGPSAPAGRTTRRTLRLRQLGRRIAPAALVLAMLGNVGAACAQAVTQPVLPTAPSSPRSDSPAALPSTTNLGEAQMEYLLDMVQDLSRPDRGLPLDLFRERVLRAVQVHPDVLAARAGLAGALEATRELEAANLPQVAARADVAGHKLDRSTISGNPERRYETASASLTLTQNVYDFGATNTAVSVGNERSAASQARLDGRRSDLALRAVQAWHEVVRSRRLLALTRLNLQSMENLTSYLNRRFELGGGPISDVWRAQSRLADTRASLASTQSRVRSAEAAFREVFDSEAGALELPALPALDRRAISADPVRLAREYPAVRSAEASRRAAEQELDLVLRRERPNVGLELSAQRRDVVGEGVPGTDLSAMLVLRYSFYSGGADRARSAQAAHRAVEAAEQVRNVTIQVERALAQSLASEDTAAAALAARREGVTLAVQALRAVREQFANRRGSLLDLLNAQEALHAAGVGLNEAEVDEALARWQVLYYSTAYWPLATTATGPR